MGKAKHTPEFKKKVALEALKDQRSLIQIAKENSIYPTQVSAWRKQLLDCAASLFENNGQQKLHLCNHEEQIAVLERKVGKLTIENDFLKKKLEQ